jgi:hypothetical protein
MHVGLGTSGAKAWQERQFSERVEVGVEGGDA